MYFLAGVVNSGLWPWHNEFMLAGTWQLREIIVFKLIVTEEKSK